MATFLLAQWITAQKLVYFQFKDNRDCSGAPDVIYETSYNDQFKGSVSTQFFSFITSSGGGSGYCGNLRNPLTDSAECCYASLNTALSGGFKSISISKYSETYRLPASISNNGYCVLSSLSNTSLFEYQRIHYRANGECNAGVKCYKNRLDLYLEPDCLSELAPRQPFEKFNVSTTLRNFSSLLMGDNSVIYEVKEKGSLFYKWTGYYPEYLVVPDFTHSGDFVGIAFIAFSFLQLSFILLNSLIEYHRTRASRNLVQFLTCIIWIIATGLRAGYYFISFQDKGTFAWYSQICFTVITIVLIIPCAMSIDLLQKISVIKSTPVWSGIIYTLLIVVHFVLTWPNYIRFGIVNKWLKIPSEIEKIWEVCDGVWFLLYYILNTIPVILTVTHFVKIKQKSVGKDPTSLGIFWDFIRLIAEDIVMASCFLGYLLNIATYAVLKAYLAYDNVVFQDDYMNLAIQIVLHSCIVNIFVLGCFVSNHMVLLFSQFKASRDNATKRKKTAKARPKENPESLLSTVKISDATTVKMSEQSTVHMGDTTTVRMSHFPQAPTGQIPLKNLSKKRSKTPASTMVTNETELMQTELAQTEIAQEPELYQAQSSRSKKR